MAVADAELRAMLRIIDAPDDADDAAPLPPSVLDALSRLFRADAVHFMRLDVDRRTIPLYQERTRLDGRPDDGADEVFWSRYWSEPFCSYPDRTGDLARVTKASDFASLAAMRGTELWQEYFGPYGVHREMMVCLDSPLRRTLRLLLCRGPGPDFGERDRALLTLLRPHLDARYRRWERPPAPATITPRQRELLALVAAGWTNRRIARHLGITEGTVRSHLENVFERLQVSSRAAAVVRAFPGGLPLSASR
jgi:DNA-binding CsgD family transcriptional regulator